MARPGFFSRQYLVQKGFQRKFILLYMAVVTVIAVLVSTILYYTVDHAVESHLYKTHIRIERVGDFLFDLLFAVNFYTILTIVLVVMVASLIVFRKINRNYKDLEQKLLAMSAGDFSDSSKRQISFFEIGRLNLLLDQLRLVSSDRVAQLDEALNILDEALAKNDDQQLVEGKQLVDNILNQVELQ